MKRELAIEAEADEGHAAYVLEQTIEIALRLDERRRLTRHVGRGKFFIRLKREGVNVYDKADRNSTVRSVTEAGLRDVTVEASTEGLIPALTDGD